MKYTTLQLALSPINPDHIKIQRYLDTLDDKRHGYRSKFVEKALLMLIDHQEIRGTDGPDFWRPIKGQEGQAIVFDPKKENQDPTG